MREEEGRKKISSHQRTKEEEEEGNRLEQYFVDFSKIDTHTHDIHFDFSLISFESLCVVDSRCNKTKSSQKTTTTTTTTTNEK